jgi:hypothetical protein
MSMGVDMMCERRRMKHHVVNQGEGISVIGTSERQHHVVKYFWETW